MFVKPSSRAVATGSWLLLVCFCLPLSADDKLTIKKLRSLENQLVSAKKSLRAYRLFLTQPNVSKQDKETAESRIRELEGVSEQGVWIVGGKKLTQAQLEANSLRAETLIAEAIKLVEVSAAKEAQKKMEEASKLDRASFQADFVMGLHAACVAKDFQLARQHFSECVDRGRTLRPVLGPVGETNLLHAINNLALTKIREDKLEEVHKLWLEALSMRPIPPPPVLHNIVRTLKYMEAAKGGPVLKVTDGTLKKYRDLVALLGDLNTANSVGQGWVYLGFIAPTEANAAARGAADGDLVGSGTGVIVYPGYVLTSRNNVRDRGGSECSVRIRYGNKASVAARVVACDERNDLALIQDASVQGKVIGLVPDVPSSNPTTWMAGYFLALPNREPELSAIDCKLTVVPVGKRRELFIECDKSRVSNGSILLDELGNLRGILVGGARLTLASSDDIAAADQVLEFLSKNIPNYSNQPSATKIDRAKISTDFSTQLVQVESMLSLTSGLSSSDPKLASIFAPVVNEHACLMCDGHVNVGCPSKNCHNGAIAVDTTFQLQDPITGQTKTVPTKDHRPCPTCGGKGVVDCPVCSNGEDSLHLGASSQSQSGRATRGR